MHHQSEITDSKATIISTRNLGGEVSLIAFTCPDIARNALPGNFVNIKINPSNQPLLRRPFSIHNVDGDNVEIMAKNIGGGTALLCNASAGTAIEVIGPLGNAFNIETPAFNTAILVSGGIGTAPMMLLEKHLKAEEKEVIHVIGGRSRDDIHTRGLNNCHIATEDGTEGFKGNVIELLRNMIGDVMLEGPVKVFACGPNPMLKALAGFSQERGLSCEVSLETIMGCGIGICYGCIVELKNQSGEGTSSMLLCQDGPVVDASRLII
ncbi:MAG: dihydroorotate dehydrogenase electron transfer subunit [Prosthecochloris sp.]|uniref:dihydroorotate dehydrogenase electron transfer subunit n=1 Tax=Prosthecochloris sp. TaxID=290513 RepID=UPI00258FCB49|nr:dihydroorotate dehydrogenase electron transfer subunit [Prosthecochloris sp.]MCW8797886.1 dihydroorotate dehydrogenase electron transfer subunit [Prosthecochloris sp.]